MIFDYGILIDSYPKICCLAKLTEFTKFPTTKFTALSHKEEVREKWFVIVLIVFSRVLSSGPSVYAGAFKAGTG